jgi:mono/diheme cytochrome c family protein
LATAVPSAAAAPDRLAGRQAPGVDPAELLLGQLNCTSCHAVEGAAGARVGARPGPVLGKTGLRLTPQWLRAWLTDPSQAKPGTDMPDVLHGLAPGERADAVESLTHFLVSLQPPGTPDPLGADPARVRLGSRLFHTVGCVACHQPDEAPEGRSDVAAVSAGARALPWTDLARKYPAGELVRFLLDPVAHRPGGRMPSMALTPPEAVALATYLLRAQVPGLGDTNRPLEAMAGLRWEYFEGSIGSCADFDRLTPKASGETSEISLAPAKRGDNYGLRFAGALEVSTRGEYTFWVASDDGTTLEVDGRRVVDNDGVHGTTERSGKVTLEPGLHTFELRFFQGGGGAEMKVRWAGPGFGRQAIPAAALKHFGQPLVPLGQAEFAVDAARAARGREWFGKLNCAACHGGIDVPARPARTLVEVSARPAEGCLAGTVPAAAPKYALGDAERELLRGVVSRARTLAEPMPPEREVLQTLARLDCFACHQRQGFGGPSAAGREPWFSVVEGADLGDEGRLPPHLEGVGGKLRSEWLRTLLTTGRKVRPYMATRMPMFGPENVETLVSALERADVKPAALAEPVLEGREAKYGRKLVGKDGLGCVNCHTFTTYGSLGVPALSLEHMHERLRWDWFQRYLPDPAALRPGTRMPTFWPEGKAVNTDILAGDTGRQIRAIFAWMKDGPKADVPAGLIRSRRELTVDREAVIYRNFIEGAGSRAIGVGYPEKANLAFDANALRLAMIWQGAFMDLSRHSTDRGSGYEPPLGDHVVKFPAGPAFAILPNADHPWPKEEGRGTGQKFLGYALDEIRRPAFRYTFQGVQVEDLVVPRVEDVDVTLVRTLRFTGEASGGTLWFRAAAGKIERGPDGTWRLEDKVRIRFRGGAGAAVLVQGELRVPLTVPGELVEEITW